MEAFTICLTGPSGGWKSALAREIEGAILERGVDVERMESGPGADDRLAGMKCAERCRQGTAVVVSAPALEGTFAEEVSAGGLRLLEVICEESEERPARSGGLPPGRGGLPAGQGPQGALLHPTFLARAGATDARRCADEVVGMLEALGYFAGSAASAAAEYTSEEEKRIAERLADLGYLD